MQSKRLRLPFTVLAVAIITNVCTAGYADTNTTMLPTTQKIIYPIIDSSLSESLYPNEAATAEKIADVIEKSIREKYSAGTALRDAHPKAHGCVRAEFQVQEKLPQNLAQGIFIPGKTYKAWIRFSNASPDASQADIKKEIGRAHV